LKPITSPVALTPCFRKKTVKIVFVISLSNFTNFDNFWHVDGQDDIIMYGALTYHFT